LAWRPASRGLARKFRHDDKPFQAGHAAESGLLSAELISLGWTAAEQILEAERGFFHAFGGSFNPEAIMIAWANRGRSPLLDFA